MPIKDGSASADFHSEALYPITGRIRQRTNDPRWEFAPSVMLNYQKAGRDLANFTASEALSFIAALNLQPSSNVLLIGSGFGWTSERLKAFVPGMGVTSTDTSGWVQSVKGTDERGDIEAALDDARDPVFYDTIVGVQGALRDDFMSWLDMGVRATEVLIEEDSLSNRSRQQIKKATTSAFTHIITASVLPWLWDDEVANLSDALHQLEGTARVVHYLNTYSDTGGGKDEPNPMLNWKRLDDATPVDSKLTDQAKYIESDWRAVLPNDEFILAGTNKVFK